MDRIRCFGSGDPLYEQYHDEEWGTPVADSPDERELFERLALEGFQSGLSWVTVLRKRDAFREAFKGFAPAEVAAFGEDDVEQLMQDASIIRNRMKIEATINNAKALVALHDDGRRLLDVISSHAPQPREERPENFTDLPSSTPESVALAKELKKLGFRFVGPVTLYATFQAIGVVDDHLAGCWLVTDK